MPKLRVESSRNTSHFIWFECSYPTPFNVKHNRVSYTNIIPCTRRNGHKRFPVPQPAVSHFYRRCMRPPFSILRSFITAVKTQFSQHTYMSLPDCYRIGVVCDVALYHPSAANKQERSLQDGLVSSPTPKVPLAIVFEFYRQRNSRLMAESIQHSFVGVGNDGRKHQNRVGRSTTMYTRA